MAVSVVEKELIRYFIRLNNSQKKSLLAMIKNFIQNSPNDILDNITLEKYNKELEEAEAEFENGNYITNEQMLKRIKQW